MKTMILTFVLMIGSFCKPASAQIILMDDFRSTRNSFNFKLKEFSTNYRITGHGLVEMPAQTRIYNFQFLTKNSFYSTSYRFNPVMIPEKRSDLDFSLPCRFPLGNMVSRPDPREFLIPSFNLSFKLHLPCGSLLQVKPFTTVRRNPDLFGRYILNSGQGMFSGVSYQGLKEWEWNGGLNLNFRLSKKFMFDIGFRTTSYFSGLFTGHRENSFQSPQMNLTALSIRFTF
jgi:hypothetical protein